MNSLVPCLPGAWLLSKEDQDEQLAIAAIMYKGMARYDVSTLKEVQAQSDWFILQLIYCSEL